MDNEIPINDEELNSQLIGFEQGITTEKKKLIIISSIVFAVIFLSVLIIIIVSTKSKKDDDKNNEGDNDDTAGINLGEINCVYDVKLKERETILLSNEFTKKTKFKI